MVATDVVWELPFAPALGHPARVSGRAEVVQFAAWFVGAVENFRFLRAVEGKIAFLRGYFDPTRAAKARNAPILDLGS